MQNGRSSVSLTCTQSPGEGFHRGLRRAAAVSARGSTPGTAPETSYATAGPARWPYRARDQRCCHPPQADLTYFAAPPTPRQ
jgi:hypothetical protein